MMIIPSKTMCKQILSLFVYVWFLIININIILTDSFSEKNWSEWENNWFNFFWMKLGFPFDSIIFHICIWNMDNYRWSFRFFSIRCCCCLLDIESIIRIKYMYHGDKFFSQSQQKNKIPFIWWLCCCCCCCNHHPSL